MVPQPPSLADLQVAGIVSISRETASREGSLMSSHAQYELEFAFDRREFHLSWISSLARSARRLDRSSGHARDLRSQARGHIRALRHKDQQIQQIKARYGVA